MPSVRTLAAESGVGHVTMWKAVKSVRAGAATPSPAPPQARRAWERVSAAIGRDLQAGQLPIEGPLPVVKELCRRYGAGPAAVVDALRSLEERGLLTRRRRQFHAWQPPAAALATVVPLYTHTGPDGAMTDATPRASELLRALEAQCVQHGLRLDARPLDRALKPGRDRGRIGALLWQAFAAGVPLPEACRSLAEGGLPLSVIDETGDSPPPPPTAGGPVRWHRFADGATAGTTVGEHVAALGHRRVVFFSVLQQSDPAVRERYLALAAAVARAGGTVDSRSAQKGRQQLEERMETSAAWDAWRRAREVFAVLAPHGYRVPAVEYGERALLCHAVQQALLPLMEDELAAARATAWTFFNDMEALAALAWLRDRKVDIPGTLSLVGIDDSIEALHGGLSSYNFNPRAVARAAIEHLLAPRNAPGGVETVTIPGMVIRRRTSAQPPTGG